jgi:hypothetical protein
MRQPTVRGHWRWLALCFLACLAVLEFSARGPVRALGWSSRDFNDFISPYVQTRAWLSGRDPYAPSTLAELWPASPRPPFLLKESADGTLPAKRGLPSPYPVLAFPVLLTFASLPWRIAICAWVVVCVLAVFTIAAVLIEFAGVRRNKQLALLIFVSVLLLAPVQTAVAASNIVNVVLAVGMVAAFCQTHNRSAWPGVLLTLALALKPTVAVPFAIYALANRNRSKVIPVAITTGIFLLSLTIIPQHGRTLWWSSFLGNSRSMFASGAIDDYSTANPLHFQLVNLQAALFPLLRNRTRTQIAAWFVSIILFGLWFRALRRDREVGLLDLAILVSITLLPLYHRFTDAGLLLAPVAWALRELKGEMKRFAAGCLLLASPFLIPGATMLQEFSERSEVLQNLSRTRLWNLVLLPHESWLILVICVLLLMARSRTRTPAGGL